MLSWVVMMSIIEVIYHFSCKNIEKTMGYGTKNSNVFFKIEFDGDCFIKFDIESNCCLYEKKCRKRYCKLCYNVTWGSK